MRALRGGIPRGFKNQKTPEGFAFRTYCLAITARFGWTVIPAAAKPSLREAGRIVVELERVGFDIDAARTSRDRNRARRQQRTLRNQLMNFESRLETLAKEGPHGRARTPAEILRERLNTTKGQASA